MSHHYSGPEFGFPHGDARLDFTDLYAFPKPGDASKSILIMNAHPSVGVNPPGPTTAVAFAPEAIYELRIDTNGDTVADIAYRVRFTSSDSGAQTATLRRVALSHFPSRGSRPCRAPQYWDYIQYSRRICCGIHPAKPGFSPYLP